MLNAFFWAVILLVVGIGVGCFVYAFDAPDGEAADLVKAGIGSLLGAAAAVRIRRRILNGR